MAVQHLFMLLLKMFGKCSIPKEKGNSKLEKRSLLIYKLLKFRSQDQEVIYSPLPPKVRT